MKGVVVAAKRDIGATVAQTTQFLAVPEDAVTDRYVGQFSRRLVGVGYGKEVGYLVHAKTYRLFYRYCQRLSYRWMAGDLAGYLTVWK